MKKISVIIQHSEHAQSLKDLGVDSIFNLYELAGIGFVEHVIETEKS